DLKVIVFSYMRAENYPLEDHRYSAQRALTPHKSTASSSKNTRRNPKPTLSGSLIGKLSCAPSSGAVPSVSLGESTPSRASTSLRQTNAPNSAAILTLLLNE